MLLLRPLALCFLVSASAFSLAKLIQTDRDFRRELTARVAVFERTVWRPAMTRARAMADNLIEAPTSDACVVLVLAPPTPAEERVVARVELAPIERPGIEAREPAMLDTPIVIAPTLPALRLQPERQAIQIVPVQPAPRRADVATPRLAPAPRAVT